MLGGQCQAIQNFKRSSGYSVKPRSSGRSVKPIPRRLWLIPIYQNAIGLQKAEKRTPLLRSSSQNKPGLTPSSLYCLHCEESGSALIFLSVAAWTFLKKRVVNAQAQVSNTYFPTDLFQHPENHRNIVTLTPAHSHNSQAGKKYQNKGTPRDQVVHGVLL